MIYLDASLIVALLVPEEHSDRADAWFAKQAVGSLFISGWVVTEVSSALSIKLRTETLTLDRRAAAMTAWHQLRDASLLTLAIGERDFVRAAQIADRYQLGVRGGDALHMSVAYESGCSLATFDQRMADAALQIGVPVEAL